MDDVFTVFPDVAAIAGLNVSKKKKKKKDGLFVYDALGCAQHFCMSKYTSEKRRKFFLLRVLYSQKALGCCLDPIFSPHFSQRTFSNTTPHWT